MADAKAARHGKAFSEPIPLGRTVPNGTVSSGLQRPTSKVEPSAKTSRRASKGASLARGAGPHIRNIYRNSAGWLFRWVRKRGLAEALRARSSGRRYEPERTASMSLLVISVSAATIHAAIALDGEGIDIRIAFRDRRAILR